MAISPYLSDGAAQSVTQAIASRRSVRAFLNTPVDAQLIRDVLAKAARAPSGGNLQPWHIHVLGGEPMVAFKALMARRIMEQPTGELPLEYDIYPKGLTTPYRDYRFRVGEDMYATLGIARDNKMGRLLWFAKNYQFFGAPLGLFCYVDRQMGPPQWSDLGMYLQTVMLLLREAGLDSCAQECWAMFHQTVRGFLSPPDTHMLFAGMAIGWKDADAPVNQLVPERAALYDYATFVGV